MNFFVNLFQIGELLQNNKAAQSQRYFIRVINYFSYNYDKCNLFIYQRKKQYNIKCTADYLRIANGKYQNIGFIPMKYFVYL